MLGPQQCKIVLKAHVLTGCDVTSKVGTKFTAPNSEPEKYLMSFGEMDEPSNESLQAAEKYLVEVVNKNSKCDNFNDLKYHFRKSLGKSLAELPPSSSCINGHLLRCHNFVRLLANLLTGRGTAMEVTSYGWQRIESVLYPDKCLLFMPREYHTTCKCSACTRNCGCRSLQILCTEYCKCGDNCKSNP